MRHALPLSIALLLACTVAHAADDEVKAPTADEARETALKAFTALVQDDPGSLEIQLDPDNRSLADAAFLHRAHARQLFLMVAEAKFGFAQGKSLDPDPVKDTDIAPILARLKTAPVWIDEFGKQALITVPGEKEMAFHLKARDGDWYFDAECLLGDDDAKHVPQLVAMDSNTSAYQNVAQDIANGKLTTPEAVTELYNRLKWRPADAAGMTTGMRGQSDFNEDPTDPAAIVAEKEEAFQNPRVAFESFLNAIRTNDAPTARAALAAPDTDEGRALEALFLRAASARAVRGAAFKKFGAVALPLDPAPLGDDAVLSPALNEVTFVPLFLQAQKARMTVTYGDAKLTLIFTYIDKNWKIDAPATLAANTILSPVTQANITLLRIAAFADFAFAKKITDGAYPTWREARDSRRTAQ